MEKLLNTPSMILGFIGGTASYFLGGFDLLLKSLLILIVLDYVTGIIKGIYNKELSSEVGFKGILKKVVILLVVATANVIQMLINNTVAIRDIVIMFFVINEALSLLENAAVIIPNMPPQLKNLLLQLRDNNENDIKKE